MIKDEFADYNHGLTAPTTRIEEISPSDDTDILRVTRAINVSAPGTVRVSTLNGDTSDIYLAAGIIFPIRVTRVWATGTTAGGIRGLA